MRQQRELFTRTPPLRCPLLCSALLHLFALLHHATYKPSYSNDASRYRCRANSKALWRPRARRADPEPLLGSDHDFSRNWVVCSRHVIEIEFEDGTQFSSQRVSKGEEMMMHMMMNAKIDDK